MIYEHFRITGTNETILEFSDLMNVTLGEDDVQGFDTEGVEVLLSVRETPQKNQKFGTIETHSCSIQSRYSTEE